MVAMEEVIFNEKGVKEKRERERLEDLSLDRCTLCALKRERE